jgi:cell wall-associated NlpC family hydrolase
MFADRGRRGAPDRALATKATKLGIVIVLGVLTGATASLAQADTISEKRAEASQVWAEIQAANVQLEKTIQLYDAATQRLAETQAAIRDNTIRLHLAKSNLAAARRDLANTLIAGYKTGKPDVLQAVLSSRSLSAMLDEVDLVQRANSYNATVVGRVRVYKAEVAHRQHDLAVQRTRRGQAVRAQAARRTEIRSEIAQKGAIYRNLKESIKELIRQKIAEERAAAAARAAAAQRALADARSTQQVSAVGLGGSAGATAAPVSSPSSSSSAPPPAPAAPSYTPPPASSVGAAAASAAMSQIGTPYVWGGASPGGFDCSGLVVWAYAQAGVSGLPHLTYSLWNAGAHVSESDLQPGDLVFFAGESHVGIYVGGGNFVHAPHTGDFVKVSSLSGYYAGAFDGAVRISG